ncbi:MAG TPA: universal stress protein [Solirubrobacteraceae bacterium]|nr:universal stress protein [Solirubrobacteraceae bacterium]
MSTALAIGVGIAGLVIGVAAGFWLPPHGHRPRRQQAPAVRRILLPFTEMGISRRAFEAAVRLAQAENATIMPAFLARVPRQLPLQSSLPVQAGNGMPLLEAIEQRAASQGIPVDSRVARGRTYRDALRRLLQEEPVDRVIVSATDSPNKGLTADDLEWLLERVPAEILILRPAPQDTRQITPEGVAGHF